MTYLTDSDGHGGADGTPYEGGFSPPSTSTMTALASAVATLDTSLPYLPPSQPMGAIPESQPTFDAAGMVASQRTTKVDPAYGAMPSGTAASKERARELREQLNRKKRRGKIFGRVLLLVLLVGLGVGGYFAYQAFQETEDDTDTADASADAGTEADADAEADADNDADGDDAAGATPLGGLVDSIEAQDALNDTPRPSVGGFLAAIEGARQAVAAPEGDAAAAPAQGPVPAVGTVLETDVTPIVLQAVAQQLADENGFERYIIDADLFEIANVGAFDRFVEVVAVQPTVESDAFGMLPGLQPREIGLAVQRVDDELARVVVVTADRSIAVDITP